MVFKRLLFVLLLGFSLLSFSTLSQAAESTHSHDEEVTHNHAVGTVHVMKFKLMRLNLGMIPTPNNWLHAYNDLHEHTDFSRG
ncbi:hypothetical protein H4683_002557 [Filibacter limicola]|uniref:Uncharacterized protein n=1 Tax=Sporosarcina limicola TaxID=34101 RepID=A0A927RFF5_9BACL|nr:hypothetical protein [Sporosarcina limicola]